MQGGYIENPDLFAAVVEACPNEGFTAQLKAFDEELRLGGKISWCFFCFFREAARQQTLEKFEICECTHPKKNMIMETPPFEDVSPPTKNG